MGWLELLALLKLLQVALPLGVEIITKFTRRADGTISAETTLIQNGIKLDAAIKQGEEFLASLPKPLVPLQ